MWASSMLLMSWTISDIHVVCQVAGTCSLCSSAERLIQAQMA